MSQHVGFLSRSLVVAGAADVVVADGVGGVGESGAGLVEAVLEDRLDAAVAGAADGEGALGGRLQAGVAVALGQAQDPEAGAVGLLGVKTPFEHGGDQGGSGRPDLLGPADEALGRPIAHPAVLLGHVLGRGGVTPPAREPDMAGDALAAVEALDGAGGQSDVELASDQRVREGRTPTSRNSCGCSTSRTFWIRFRIVLTCIPFPFRDAWMFCSADCRGFRNGMRPMRTGTGCSVVWILDGRRPHRRSLLRHRRTRADRARARRRGQGRAPRSGAGAKRLDHGEHTRTLPTPTMPPILTHRFCGRPQFGSVKPEENFTHLTVQFSGSLSHIPVLAYLLLPVKY